jgi:hypothetical protein
MPMFWLWVGYAVLFASVVYLALNQPKVPDATVQTGQAPTAEEGREIPVHFGTVMVRDPNIVYYGNLGTSPILSDGGKK